MSEAFVSLFDAVDKSSSLAPAQIRELRDEVFSIRQKVRQHLDRGLAPDETEAARGLLRAAEIAEEIVGRLAA
jgi:hypothetical protein